MDIRARVCIISVCIIECACHRERKDGRLREDADVINTPAVNFDFFFFLGHLGNNENDNPLTGDARRVSKIRRGNVDVSPSLVRCANETIFNPTNKRIILTCITHDRRCNRREPLIPGAYMPSVDAERIHTRTGVCTRAHNRARDAFT